MADVVKTGENKGRLKEILTILSKHNVILGLTPPKLNAILEDLGPTFVKLGQIMSMRPDMIPAAYCEELQKLRANVKPMSREEVCRVVESSLDCKLHDAFPTFDFTPLGSASIAQAHRATLKTGESVVVKVQREGIHDVMESDIALLRKASGLLKLTGTGDTIDLNMVLDEMWVVSQEEMNFITEAQNAETFRRLNADVTYVSCPKIYRELSTRQLLVMEAIDGCAIDDREALLAGGYDLREIGTKLCVNYLKQVLDDGFFHADPHPGNIRIRDGQIVWIDLGMVGRLSAKDQAHFQKGVAAVASRDVSGLMEAVLSIGKHTAPIDREALFGDVDALLAEYGDMEMASMDLGQALQQVLELAKKHKISMPPGVTMLARGLCTIQGVLADVAPEVSVMELVSQRFALSGLKQVDWKKEAQRGGMALYESAQKSLSIPALLSDTLRAAQKGELRLRTEAQTSPEAEAHTDRRLHTLMHGLLLCSLFLGSSLMCLAPIEPRALGLPWPSAAGFAAMLGCMLYSRIKRMRHK